MNAEREFMRENCKIQSNGDEIIEICKEIG